MNIDSTIFLPIIHKNRDIVKTILYPTKKVKINIDINFML